MPRADVVIVGAGFAGAATAYHLAERGVRDICILEHEPRPGVHASGRNAHLSFQSIVDGPKSWLAAEGARFIANPPAGFTDVPLLRQSGSLLVASERGLASIESAQAISERLGLGGTILPVAEACARVPALEGAPIAHAFWNPHDGVVDIERFLACYLDAACRLGARVRYNCTVTGVQSSGGRVTAVDTSTGTIATETLVNATGAWSREIGVLAGVGTRTLQARRRHLFEVRVNTPVMADWSFVWHYDHDIYFRPEGVGVLVSPCDASDHPAQPPDTDPAVEELLHRKIERAFPRLAPIEIVAARACLRTFSADERFLIGRDPDLDGFVWVTGLAGHGVTTSAAVGRVAAAAVIGETPPEAEAFSPQRDSLASTHIVS